jgi:SAM-dependent methyltransferase
MLFRPSAVECNICGATAFVPGPGGRLAETGWPPSCVGCDSLERHRALRRLMERLPGAALAWRRGLQVNPDPAMRPHWFKTHEVALADAAGGLDLSRIDRPDGAYDFITLNLTLEFVPDARSAFRELLRVLSPDGILEIGFAEAGGRAATLDYDEPQGGYGFFHRFGRDFARYFELQRLGAVALVLTETDTATGHDETFHFFAKDRAAIAALAHSVARLRTTMDGEAGRPRR